MDTLTQLLEISSRLDHVEQSTDWIAKETALKDNTVSQTATLVSVLTDDIRERIYDLVKEIEKIAELSELH